MKIFKKTKVTSEINNVKNARFIVLGACCKKSKQTYESTIQAVKELGIEDKVINIGDIVEISKYGVLQTPALVIDNVVVSYGKALSIIEIKNLIEKELNK
ncbi:MAG: thioredoxin family protein [Oscillospiraceae bacterium]